MTSDLAIFAARLREYIRICADEFASDPGPLDPAVQAHYDAEFNAMALVLFALQFDHNPAYRKFCEARSVTPNSVTHWSQIPAAPTSAFKELELTCLPEEERTTVFHSSGTTGQRPSRHFHSAESLAVYEASLWPWFAWHCLGDLRLTIDDLRAGGPSSPRLTPDTSLLTLLAPRPAQAPHSSLVHMFETLRRRLGAPGSAFLGGLAPDGSWTLDFDGALGALRAAARGRRPLILLGTAFSFVHLLDRLAQKDWRFNLPAGSPVMETGGYKGRSRRLPGAELHSLISDRLGIPADHIVCEYGMCELSSQAYDQQVSGAMGQGSGAMGQGSGAGLEARGAEGQGSGGNLVSRARGQVAGEGRTFRFPPWARARVISPENGGEVAEGETGLLRVFDLANVFSVMAIQTEDLAVRRGDGFELLGRAESVEPRGCSLMAGGA